LVEQVGLRAGERALEIAAGSDPLILAMATSEPIGSLVCTDLDPAAMKVASARRRVVSTSIARAAFVAADMRRLPFRHETFDGALCRLGFMLVREPSAAFREARRVLRPGGRLALAVWGAAAENPWQSILDEALSAFGLEDRSRQVRPGGMFSLADEPALQDLVREAGFSVALTSRIPLVRRYVNFDDYWAREGRCRRRSAGTAARAFSRDGASIPRATCDGTLPIPTKQLLRDRGSQRGPARPRRPIAFRWRRNRQSWPTSAVGCFLDKMGRYASA